MQCASFIHRRSVALSSPKTCRSICLTPSRISFHGCNGVLRRGSQIVGSGSGNPGQPSSTQKSLSNLELLLGGLQRKQEGERAGGGDESLKPEQRMAGSQSNAPSSDDDGRVQQQQQPVLERFIDWASAAFSAAWGGPLAIPAIQAQANATLSMPTLEPYMAYLLYYAHILIYGGILAADIYWGPGSAGDLTLALSNDHLAVESGGELWRLATCTFVHSTPINLFVTLAALLLWAADLERAVGLWIFAAIVSLATTSGTVCDLLYDDLPVTQGAIPAVAGTVGALLVEKRKNFLFYEKVMNAKDQQRKQRQWRLDSAAAIRQATWDAKASTPASDPLTIWYADGYGGGSESEGSSKDLQEEVAQATSGSSSSSSSSTSTMDAYSSMASTNTSRSSDGHREAASGDQGGTGVSLSTSAVLPPRRNRLVLAGGARADGANVMDGWGSSEGGPSGGGMGAGSSPATNTMTAASSGGGTAAGGGGATTVRAATMDSTSTASSSNSSMTAHPSSALSTSSAVSTMVTSPDSSHQASSGRKMEAWEGYEQGYSTSTGGSITLVSDNLLTQLQQRRRRRRRYIEPPPPKEERHEVATVELFEGLFKFSGVVSSENRAWLSVATTFFGCVDVLRDLTSTDDCTISIAGVVGAFIAGALISLGLSPQYTVVLEPVLASNANSGAPLLSPEQRAAANLPMSSTTSSMGSLQSGTSMDSLQSMDGLDDMQGEDKYVWGLAVRDKVPTTQRFLTVTTALALLSYCVYELLI
ncbi:hypothetical protein DUNSADRAFT_13838 [Dunaliella salina]|uniref:Peptidase S54 rhomboid domain-containing protein n=1 Tax=Dunaliella salina TaxID=3046 RepID=A0ABQ7G8L1_DUNSA|nr:hypothetical protein DUNSADRAFT_13838 [Dunaliella salina]|eukprot:KAF5830930.1 hypothetical protein DUNSADRAFT_13838 [Dunaliella salina]